MSRPELILALTAMAGLLQRGRIDELTKMFATPLPFFADGQFALLRDDESVKQALRHYHQALRILDISALRPVIIAVEDATLHRCLLVIALEHARPDGSVMSTCKARVILQRDGDNCPVKLELLECLDLNFVNIAASSGKVFSR